MLGFFSSAFFSSIFPMWIFDTGKSTQETTFLLFSFLFSLVYFISPSYQKPAVTKTIEFTAREIFIKGFFSSSGFL